MNLHTVERALVGATLLLLVSATARWYRMDALDAAPAPNPIAIRRTSAALPDSMLQEAEDLAVSNDPFRLSNTPSDVRYDPATEGGSGAKTPVAAVRPSFTLKAIIGGPPWHAVIDGIPGQPAGTVVRQGAQYDKLIVRTVSRDSVIIQAPDTSWILQFGARP